MRAALHASLFTASLVLASCQTNGMQTLAPNMVRLDLTGVPAASDTEVAFRQVLSTAARETLARSYIYFRLRDWTPGPTKVVAPGEPLTANFAVTIVMMHEGEQGSGPAFDARQIVSQGERPAP